MTWYGVAMSCKKCGVDTTLQLMAYSADGEIQLTFYCPTCKELLVWNVFASQLQHTATVKDWEKTQKILVPSRLKPLVKPPPDKLTDKDKRLLKDFGIGEDV